MPFQKGNTLAKKGVQAREKRKEDLWALIAGGHKDDYNEKLEKLRDGKELSKPEQQFCDRVERLFPYTKARKTDITSDNKPIEGVLVLPQEKIPDADSLEAK